MKLFKTTLRFKIILSSVTILVATTLVVLSSGINDKRKNLVENIKLGHKLDVEGKASSMDRLILEAKSDVSFLIETPPIQGIIRARNHNGIDPKDGTKISDWKDRLITIVSKFILAKPSYFQIRYLNAQGNELIRINSDGKGVIEIVKKENLQNKKSSEYFRKTMNLKKGEFYISEFNLNIEKGKIQRPFTPVIRIASPVFSKTSSREGIFVVNVFGKEILGVLNTKIEGEKYYLANEKGYFLKHPDPTKEWGFMLKNKNTVRTILGENVRDLFFSNEGGSSENINNELISYKRIYFDKLNKKRYWVISRHLNEQIISNALYGYIKKTLAFFGVCILIGIAFLYFILTYLFNSLTKIAINLNENAAELGGMHLDLDGTSSTLEKDVKIQFQSFKNIFSSIQDINEMASKSSESAERSNILSNENLLAVMQGQEAMQEMNTSINEINITNQDVIKFLNTIVNVHLEEINRIIEDIAQNTDIINEIVFKTSLLSFNASIEAARAGEHGRGFSVVAREVGNLANISGEASVKISDMLNKGKIQVNEIITDSRKNIEKIKTESLSKIQFGLEKVEYCHKMFIDISSNSINLGENASKIAKGSKEQGKEIQAVTATMNRNIQGSEKNFVLTKQAASVSRNLGHQSELISTEARNFLSILYGEYSHDLVVIKPFIMRDEWYLRVDAMDDEHLILIDFINVFIERLNYGLKEEIKQAMIDLYDYTVEHFRDEEKFMATIDYWDIINHKKVHTSLLATFKSYVLEIENDNLDYHKVAAFIRNWLVVHIQNIDMRYADHYRKTKQSA